ncbi:MAG: TetR/AcrR family transcriptional regulator [Pseudomonadota bacterium]
MPRAKTYTRDEIVSKAMHKFWRDGFAATSMDDLVRCTEVSRHGIYAAYGGKRDLFLACLEVYRHVVVTPAFARVEEEGAGLKDIEQYFEQQISLAEASGLPGPGCLFANTMTETGPHEARSMAAVRAHNDRLACGFHNALRNEANKRGGRADAHLGELAAFLTISAQGLWSMSRAVESAEPMRSFARLLLELTMTRLDHGS